MLIQHIRRSTKVFRYSSTYSYQFRGRVLACLSSAAQASLLRVFWQLRAPSWWRRRLMALLAQPSFTIAVLVDDPMVRVVVALVHDEHAGAFAPETCFCIMSCGGSQSSLSTLLSQDSYSKDHNNRTTTTASSLMFLRTNDYDMTCVRF